MHLRRIFKINMGIKCTKITFCPIVYSPLWHLVTLSRTKALRKTVFAEIFVFASLRNWHFSKIRVGTSFLSFYWTRLDSRKLVPTCSDTNFCEKLWKNRKKIAKKCFFLRFSLLRVSVIAFFHNFHFREKNDVQLISSRLAKTHSDSKLDSKFWIKVWNAGPYREPPPPL